MGLSSCHGRKNEDVVWTCGWRSEVGGPSGLGVQKDLRLQLEMRLWEGENPPGMNRSPSRCR